MTAKLKRAVMLAACFQETGPGRHIRVHRDKEVVFSQGSPANALFYIQSGIVTPTTASKKVIGK
jgi:CRP-like cAMP-binding protein